MTEILRETEGNLLGLDKDDNLLIKGTKIILDHLKTEKTLEIIGSTLRVNGSPIGAGSTAFDNTGTTLTSITLQDAIVELSAKVDQILSVLS